MSEIRTEPARSGGLTPKGLARKTELADQALLSLAMQSYARTSLRDIASAADINLGRLHYYFSDRIDLVIFAVQRFQATFVAELAQVIDTQRTIEAAIAKLVHSALTATQMHRFWYDLRNQALFEPRYRDIVIEIDRDLKAITAALLLLIDPMRDVAPHLDLAYGALDGIFLRAIQAVVYGEENIAERMTRALTTAADEYRRMGLPATPDLDAAVPALPPPEIV